MEWSSSIVLWEWRCWNWVCLWPECLSLFPSFFHNSCSMCVVLIIFSWAQRMGCIQENGPGQSQRATYKRPASEWCVGSCMCLREREIHLCMCQCLIVCVRVCFWEGVGGGGGGVSFCSGRQQVTLIVKCGCGQCGTVAMEEQRAESASLVTCVSHIQRWQWIFTSPRHHRIFQQLRWFAYICIKVTYTDVNYLWRGFKGTLNIIIFFHICAMKN